MKREELQNLVVRAAQEEVMNENLPTIVALDTDLRSCGLDSLNVVDIAREVEDEMRDLGHNIIFDYSESYNTPNDFVDEAMRQIVDEAIRQMNFESHDEGYHPTLNHSGSVAAIGCIANQKLE